MSTDICHSVHFYTCTAAQETYLEQATPATKNVMCYLYTPAPARISTMQQLHCYETFVSENLETANTKHSIKS